MKSEPYTGTTAAMKNSPWLASEDLLGLSSPELVIAGVYRNTDVEMDGGRIEKQLFSIAFKGATKQMILNSTNRRALSVSYGADVKGWVGKKVKLYVQEGVRLGKKTVNGLRIQPVDPPTVATGASKPFTPPQPKPEAPALTLSAEPETALQRLNRRIHEDKLDEGKVDVWLLAQSMPTLDQILENEAEAVLANYEQLKEEAK